MKKKKKSNTIPLKLKKLIKDAAKRHAWNIGVSHYECSIWYMKEDIDPRDGNRGHVVAEALVDRRYLTLAIRIYPCAIEHWKKDGDEYMEDVVAHEVAHAATEHFKDMAYATFKDDGELKDAWETCTQVIARLSVNLDKYKRGKKKKKK